MGKDSEKGKYESPEGSKFWEYLSAFFCTFLAFGIGTPVGWNSPSLSEFASPNAPVPMTAGDLSTIAAVSSIGQIIAPILSIFVVDRIGRRNTILLSNVPLMISWGLIVIAEHVMVFVIARMLAGFSIGLLSCTIPIYVGEVFSKNFRGSVGTMGLIMFNIGILFMFVVAPYLGVRITAFVCMITVIFSLICFLFAPESPYFLINVGRIEEAEKALEKLYGKTDVTDELELIKATLREKGKSLLGNDETKNNFASTTDKQNVFKQLLTIRGNLKGFFIAINFSIMTHFCGYTAVLAYCQIIIDDTGFKIDTHNALTLLGVLQVISGILVVTVVEKIGRRPILYVTGVISVIFAIIIGGYFYLMDYTDIEIKQYAIIPVSSVFLYIVSLNMGVIALPSIIISEIFSSDVKTLANCLYVISGGFMGFLSVKSYLLIVQTWGFGHSVPFLGYAISTLFLMALLVPCLPETRGKTLLDIQRILNA